MILKQMYIHILKKKELDSYPTAKVHLNDNIPKNKRQKYKVSDEKAGEHFDNLGKCNISLNRTQKTLNLNEKIDNFYFLKINNYCYQKK